MDESAALHEQLWFELRRAATLMERTAEAVVRRETGATLAVFMVLSVLDAHPEPVNQQAIADRLALTKGTVSKLLDSAKAGGLVVVDVASHSRRERAVSLTEAGRAIVRAGDRALARSPLARFPHGEPDAARATVHALRGFVRSLDGDRAAADPAAGHGGR